MLKAKFIAIAAVSLDGKIAAYPGQNTTWTSKEDKQVMHELLDACDVILVGRKTYEIAIKPLSKRNCIVLTSRPSIYKHNRRALFINPEKQNLRQVIQKLGYKKVAMLGGEKVYTYCLRKRLIDEVFLTIEPVIFGAGINLFSLKKFLAKQPMKLISHRKLNRNGTLLLHYKLAF